jgi:hypothetical protein
MSVYWVIPTPGKEPNEWKTEKFAEIGGGEKFVRDMCELQTILNATSIFGQKREEVNDAIMTILFDGLMPAFHELQGIREAEGKQIPILDRRELYHDFSRKLWKAYKDLTQRAALEAGFNIGFLFKDASDFKNGLKEFQQNYPNIRPELGESLEEVRTSWQNETALFRNTFLEHQNSDPARYVKFYELKYVEWLFEQAWNTIVDLMAVLLEAKMPSHTKLALPDLNELPNWPNRFVFHLSGVKFEK